MPDGREVDQGELLGVAKDEERARSLLRALRTLSTGPDPKLREMASGVLRGDLTAEQAFTDPEYTAALFSGADRIRRAGERRTEAEAREAGERFGAWQAARDAVDEDEGEGEETAGAPSDAPSRPAPRPPSGPWGQPGAGGLGGSRPAGPFGHR
ncbi:hypothetical protein M2161_003521 [Streptomyces sp. SAI-133]|uniref:hypothetical protein n=1 Tax=unclassified Streptomyces TaxID=2593676 RepID=UPI002475A733|nr:MULTISPECIES: hypothetical protein [unclassified Streptomyces]MDH6551529.1 hypothetical protein [Streptomyces sp. SAI-041]MDH6584415.1 hypothetical protein [Streptomyces sp. SAI-133]